MAVVESSVAKVEAAGEQTPRSPTACDEKPGAETDVADAKQAPRPTTASDEKAGAETDVADAERTPRPTTASDEKASAEAESADETFQPRDATEEEIESLPHVTDRVPVAAWVVVLAGAAERSTYFGIIAPWRHSVPGALDLGQATATNISNAFFLFSFMTPMLFGLVSDIWLGRYRTLMVGLTIYLCGCVLLLTTSLPAALDNGAGLGGLIGAMILIGLGVGAVKATFYPFLGDQYVRQKPQLARRENGELVVQDATRTLQLMYNIYYWFTNVAGLSTLATTFLEKEYDFWAANLFATISLVVSIVVLVVWAGKLVKPSPEGNNLPMATRTVLCAAKSGFELDHAKQDYQRERYGRTVPWTDHFVDEMKRGLLACRVILSFVVFHLCIVQMFNNLVSQAGQMELHGIPNDMVQAFSGVACVIFGPAIQAMYSFLARRKIAFGPIARITAAFFFCGGAMAYAAGVQQLIYDSPPCFDRPFDCAASTDGRQPNEVNVWIQLPLYFILALAEIFGFVTASEYAYSKAPRDMKTIVQALTQLTACLGSVLGMALSPVSRDPFLVTMYACLAGSMGLSTVLFWWKFHKYDRVDGELDRLDDDVPEESDRASA